jgi:hypothetical protein
VACPRSERQRRDWLGQISTGIHKELERVLSLETLGPAEVTSRAVGARSGGEPPFLTCKLAGLEPPCWGSLSFERKQPCD